MSWKIEYVFLIVFATAVNYFGSIAIEGSNCQKKKKIYLSFCIIATLSILFCFKYLTFFSIAFNDFCEILNIPYELPILKVLLPVGISFFTFQSLSYTIDVYRKKVKAEHHLGIFALFISYFPQLVAGPIERSNLLIPQLKENNEYDEDRIINALKLILWGFLKKVVVADRLAVYVNTVYNNVYSYEGLTLCIATYFFAFQIYCDFSGYTDIARGVARMMGVNLSTNFNRPYASKSIREFWTRWHITLSNWFRDYVYFPLGGNRKGFYRQNINVLIVFALSGLWHGANWTFIIWGGLHGLFRVIENLLQRMRSIFFPNNFSKSKKLINLYQILRWAITFHLIVFSWIFF